MGDERAGAFAGGETERPFSRDEMRGAVVVGYDGSEHARRALAWAARESRLRDARLVPAVAIPPMVSYGVPASLDETALEAAAQLAKEAARVARDLEPDVHTTSIRVVSPPARALLQLAQDAQLIVVGSRGHGGVASMILGSVSLRVAQHAACPTVVVPFPGGFGEHHRIVVGVDGSAPSRAALSFALSEAALRDATVVAVHAAADPYLGGKVRPPAPDLLRARAEAGNRFLNDELAPWRRAHPEIDITATLTREPAETALAEHASGADMLVLGARGRGTVTGLFLGSVSHAALHAATVPVALLHAPPANRAEPS